MEIAKLSFLSKIKRIKTEWQCHCFDFFMNKKKRKASPPVTNLVLPTTL
jgi:hypothetical protein